MEMIAPCLLSWNLAPLQYLRIKLLITSADFLGVWKVQVEMAVEVRFPWCLWEQVWFSPAVL